MKYRHCILLIVAILVIDQVSKVYIKTHFTIGEHIDVIGTWFQIYFIENEGMAFGMTISDAPAGKLVLTLFRLVAVVFGFFYLKTLIKKGHSRGLMIIACLILAGAAGNLIDSVFYGMIFTASTTHQVAQLVPWGEGYTTLFHGKVVDMLYFPMVEFVWPEWLPIIGGDNFLFFAPIFNIADMAITTGVLVLLVFQRKLIPHLSQRNTEPTDKN